MEITEKENELSRYLEKVKGLKGDNKPYIKEIEKLPFQLFCYVLNIIILDHAIQAWGNSPYLKRKQCSNLQLAVGYLEDHEDYCLPLKNP